MLEEAQDSSLETSKGAQPCDNLISDSGFQDYASINVHCSKPPGLWKCVTATLGN